VPEWPKPPAARTVAGNSATSSHVTRATGATTSCAIRIPRDTTNGSRPKLINGTRSVVAVKIKDGNGKLLPTAIPKVTFAKTARYLAENAGDPGSEIEVFARLEKNLHDFPLAGFVAEGLLRPGLTRAVLLRTRGRSRSSAETVGRFPCRGTGSDFKCGRDFRRRRSCAARSHRGRAGPCLYSAGRCRHSGLEFSHPA